jgi:hypothetical protein
MSEDGEDVWQELQEAHATGDGESSSWVYDWSTRCELPDILKVRPPSKHRKKLQTMWGPGALVHRPL